MKRSLFSGIILLSITFLLSSCSSEENPVETPVEKSGISFGAFLNNQVSRQGSKQESVDFLRCVSSTPTFADIILTKNGVPMAGTMDEPLRIRVNPNPIDTNNDGNVEYFTEETTALDLTPGTYFLEYFTLLDAEEVIIWIAPTRSETPGSFSDLMENPLPMEINLRAGVQKQVQIEVLCFDDREVNQYGYMFFELNGVQVIEFCIFGNYCFENGRHAEAVRYNLSVWNYSGDPLNPAGDPLYLDLESAIVVTDYEDYADTAAVPLCISLPDGPGPDEYYVEITLLDYEPVNTIIRKGVLTDEDVKALFDEETYLEYYHFREGNCSLKDSPILFDTP